MFFSDNRTFAYFILAATFINPIAGFSGLLAVLAGIVFSKWMGFNSALISSGTFTFNCLTTGLIIGMNFKISVAFFLLLFIFSFIAVLFSKSIYILFYKYGLPIFGLPFILTAWLLIFSTRSFEVLQVNGFGLYIYNELFAIGGNKLTSIYEFVNNLKLSVFVETYFKSLGAIYFQHNVIAGFLIAVGLLIYSRIAFSLSLIGYATGFLFSSFVLGDVSHLTYGYIGFNYILVAISLGGFYVIPSRKSYLLAVCGCVMVVILQVALMKMLAPLQLPLFSLPSGIFILLTLLTLKNRTTSNGLELVMLQQFSPEKNLYQHKNNLERYNKNTFIAINPPFFGEWFVSQGHFGSITHKGDYSYAWDFVLTDDLRKTFQLPGKNLTDFYCYNVPIVAPAAGYVYQIIDGIDDNLVGEVDVQNNWGNTVIIKHSEYLFSKISHIKKESFKVFEGQYVYAGTVLATCGNSGRSPEPHIHFQLQATPYIGSKTINYPLGYYISKHVSGKYDFHSFETPLENSVVCGIQNTTLLANAFYFAPGKILSFEVKTKDGKKEKIEIVRWEIFTDALNQTYIYCHQTKSTAYFVNNFTLHYFTTFYGDKKSLLYYFFVGAHKILLAYYKDLAVEDILPIENFYNGASRLMQDFFAPFKIYLKPTFKAVFMSIDDLYFPTQLKIETIAKVKMGSKILREIDFEIEINKDGIANFICIDEQKTITATCLNG